MLIYNIRHLLAVLREYLAHDNRHPRTRDAGNAHTVSRVIPVEVVTDAAPVYPAVFNELIPSAWHHVERHADNSIEADHSQLKHRLRAMRGLRTDRTAQVAIAGHTFCLPIFARCPVGHTHEAGHRLGWVAGRVTAAAGQPLADRLAGVRECVGRLRRPAGR